jgi:hypothetical protein
MLIAVWAIITPTMFVPAAIVAVLPRFHQTFSVALTLFMIRTDPPVLMVNVEPILNIQ